MWQIRKLGVSGVWALDHYHGRTRDLTVFGFETEAAAGDWLVRWLLASARQEAEIASEREQRRAAHTTETLRLMAAVQPQGRPS